MYADMRNANKILVGKPQRKVILGRPSHSWEYDIKRDFR
jgi:hypothetical protein